MVIRQLIFDYDGVFIDDSEANIDSAINAGLHGIVFKNVGQMFDELKIKYGVRV